MSDQSRRKFLQTTSVGGAAAGIAVLLPRLGAQASPVSAKSATAQDAALGGIAGAGAAGTHAGPFVAYVKNAKTGEIAVLAGEHEVVHQDPHLAARLAQVAAQLPQA